jgi:hypothetical protein
MGRLLSILGPSYDSGTVDSLRTGLMFAYRNNGTDRSGNGWNLPTVGTAGTAEDLFTGAPGGSMLLDGLSRFDNGPGNGAPMTPAQPFTFSLWGNANGIAGSFVEADLSIGVGSPITYKTVLELIRFNDVMYVRAYFVTSTDLTVPVPAADATVRHNAMFSWDGATLRLYLDGVLIASQAQSAPPPEAYFDEIYIDGVLKQQLIVGWNRALSDGGVSVGQSAVAGSEVARNYNNGNGFDPTA